MKATAKHIAYIHEANKVLEWRAQCWHCGKHTLPGSTCEHCGGDLRSRDGTKTSK